jgi:Outer membrane protein beta-barrel domain
MIASLAAFGVLASSTPAPYFVEGNPRNLLEFRDLEAGLAPTQVAPPAPPSAVDSDPSDFPQSASEQWISISALFVDTQYLTADYSGDRSTGLGMSFGAWWWQPNNLGGAAEWSFFYDGHHATALGLSGDVDTWDLMLGGRFGVRSDSGRWVAYGKGGALYRIDEGNHANTISSDGWGGYVGAGVEWRMSEHFALAPDCTWTFADVAGSSRQFVAALNFVVRF